MKSDEEKDGCLKRLSVKCQAKLLSCVTEVNEMTTVRVFCALLKYRAHIAGFNISNQSGCNRFVLFYSEDEGTCDGWQTTHEMLLHYMNRFRPIPETSISYSSFIPQTIVLIL
jgi:hypothetical protein